MDINFTQSVVDLNSFSVERLLEYFLQPKRTGYDMPKTLTYGLLLVAAVYAIYEVLKKLKVKIDRRLAIAISPYVVLGSSIRVLEDLGRLQGNIFVTPGIYIFVFAITISVLLISLFIERKKGVPYFKIVFTFGVFIMSLPIGMLIQSLEVHVNLYGALLSAAFFIPWILLMRFIRWRGENKAAMLLQMLDATVTFVSLQFFNFYEQHILPTAFIDMFGPASFIAVKAVATFALIMVIDKFSKDRQFNTYIKLVIGVLGAATGTRDLLALMALG
jgi:uncharacterized membrane protein